jgi:hypothetical protein
MSTSAPANPSVPVSVPGPRQESERLPASLTIAPQTRYAIAGCSAPGYAPRGRATIFCRLRLTHPAVLTHPTRWRVEPHDQLTQDDRSPVQAGETAAASKSVPRPLPSRHRWSSQLGNLLRTAGPAGSRWVPGPIERTQARGASCVPRSARRRRARPSSGPRPCSGSVSHRSARGTDRCRRPRYPNANSEEHLRPCRNCNRVPTRRTGRADRSRPNGNAQRTPRRGGNLLDHGGSPRCCGDAHLWERSSTSSASATVPGPLSKAEHVCHPARV